jgi:uncharacterized cupin superfamily protein
MKLVHTSELPWQTPIEHGKFLQRRKELGGEKILCGIWELPPGKSSFPLHRHFINEEAMYVLSGRAKVRTTDGETAIGPGDFLTFPAGGPAHQIINDGAEPLVYLAMSSSLGSELVEYPDSGKIAFSVGAGASRKRFMFRGKEQVDYFDGED